MTTPALPDPATFDAPVESLLEARRMIDALHAVADARAIALPAPPEPPEPEMCCGRGCTPCIYTYFYDALEHWRVAARAALR